jgi:hypothetical protein
MSKNIFTDCFVFDSLNCDRDDDINPHMRLNSTPGTSPTPKSGTSTPPESQSPNNKPTNETTSHRRTNSFEKVKSMFMNAFPFDSFPDDSELRMKKDTFTPSQSPPKVYHKRSKSIEKSFKHLTEIFQIPPEESPENKKLSEKQITKKGSVLTDVPMEETENSSTEKDLDTSGNNICESNFFHSDSLLASDEGTEEIDHPDIVKYLK